MTRFQPLRILAVILALAAAGCWDKTGDVQRLLVSAKQEREKGGHKAAVIYLKDLLQKEPDNAEARYLLGATYNDVGDYRAAESELRRAISLGYDRAQAVPALGKSLVMMAEFRKVLDEVRLEGGSTATEADVLTLRGLASVGLGRGEEGRRLLDEALAKQPEHVDALLGQARLAAADRKLDESAKLIDRVLASSPKNADALLMKGDLARMRGDQPAAFAAYDKVIEVNPENLAARLNLITMYVDKGEADNARKQLEQLRKVAPGSPMGNYMQALIEFRQKNMPLAREKALQALKAMPNHLPSLLLAGAAEAALGSHAQAQGYLAQVLERTPANLYARRLMVSSLAATGQMQRAIETLQPALKQAPDDPSVMGLAGDVYMRSNEFARASEYFAKAAKLDPKSAGLRTGLGMSRLAQGDTERALGDLESAVDLDSATYQADIVLVLSNLRQARYDAALKAVAGLEKKQPANPLTHNLKAAVYLGKKDLPAARKSLERALELQPTYVPAALNLAQLDLQEGKQKEARGRFETILQKDKDNVQALLALANLAPRIGATPKEGIDWLERASKAAPAVVQPKILLARAYADSGDVKRALDIAQQANAASPDNPEVLDALGAMQLGSGAREQALATYGRLVALQPESPVALYRLANAQAANANPAAATASLKKALALRPNYAEAHVALVELELRAKNYAGAMKLAGEVQKQFPKSPMGLVLEGDVLMAEQKYQQAVKAYSAAGALGRSGALMMKLHAAHSLAGKADEAEALLARWLKESPEDLPSRFYAAEVNLKGGKLKAAIEQYEWLSGRQPNNVLVLNNLAWAYQQVKDPRAMETAERAYKLRPDNAAIADTLGWMLVEQGNTARGLELLQKAVAAAPNASDIRFHLAQAWMKSGDRAKARDELERLLANDTKFPQQAEAASLLKQLKK